MNTANLSPKARTALTNTNGGSRQGATIPTGTDPAVVSELLAADLIGPLQGLTMKGTIARDRIQTEDLDRYF